MDYEKDIKIDETALDIEWLEQPRLMLKYTRYAAQLQSELDQVKENLDLVKASLDKEIRDDPGKFNISKPTETAILNVVMSHTRYRVVSKEYNEAKFELEVARGAVRAFDQRKEALENLVKLHGQQYFAGPKVPRDISREWQDHQNQQASNKIVGKTFKRKTE